MSSLGLLPGVEGSAPSSSDLVDDKTRRLLLIMESCTRIQAPGLYLSASESRSGVSILGNPQVNRDAQGFHSFL